MDPISPASRPSTPLTPEPIVFEHDGIRYEVTATQADGSPISLDVLSQAIKINCLFPKLLAAIKANTPTANLSEFTVTDREIQLTDNSIQLETALDTVIAEEINKQSITPVSTFKDLRDRLFESIDTPAPLNVAAIPITTLHIKARPASPAQPHVEVTATHEMPTRPPLPPSPAVALSAAHTAPLSVHTTEDISIAAAAAAPLPETQLSFLDKVPSTGESAEITQYLGRPIERELLEKLQEYYRNSDERDGRSATLSPYLQELKAVQSPSKEEWETLKTKLTNDTEALSDKEKAMMRLFVVPHRRLFFKPTQPSWLTSAKVVSAIESVAVGRTARA